MIGKEQKQWDRRSVLLGGVGAVLGLAGCGGGGTDADDAPATRLVLFPTGGAWRYRIYPYATQETFLWTDIYYVRPGSARLRSYNSETGTANDLFAFRLPESTLVYDVDTPGALLRINQVTPFNVQLRPVAVYGGTFRQDPATRDLYLLRLPSGELLDTPAKILPGTWSATTAFTSEFVVGGQTKGTYSLTVTGPEKTTPFPEDRDQDKTPTWKTTVVATGALTDLSGTFWYEPTSGQFTQMIPAGGIDIDRKIQGFTIFGTYE